MKRATRNLVVLFILQIISHQPVDPSGKEKFDAKEPRSFQVSHIFVALCDNKYQGIVPVPAFLGNGQDGKENLYWGAASGVRSWFTAKKGW